MEGSVLRHAFHAICLLCGSLAAHAAPFEMTLAGSRGEAIAGSVVSLRSTDASRPRPAPVRATLDQVDLTFVPHVLVLPLGSKVDFPNSDKVPHQVYSFSPARRFELPLYSGKVHEPVDFPLSGIVALGCNVHDQMRAYLYVVDAHYFGRTDEQGIWRAPDVAPGEYDLVIWHPLARGTAPILEQRITIGGTVQALKLRLPRPLKLRPMSQVPANWDAY